MNRNSRFTLLYDEDSSIVALNGYITPNDFGVAYKKADLPFAHFSISLSNCVRYDHEIGVSVIKDFDTFISLMTDEDIGFSSTVTHKYLEHYKMIFICVGFDMDDIMSYEANVLHNSSITDEIDYIINNCDLEFVFCYEKSNVPDTVLNQLFKFINAKEK